MQKVILQTKPHTLLKVQTCLLLSKEYKKSVKNHLEEKWLFFLLDHCIPSYV